MDGPDPEDRRPDVSMKSGLRDRNNVRHLFEVEFTVGLVSMKSGLRDRNNVGRGGGGSWSFLVSMKSGLRDRNNLLGGDVADADLVVVSMKSGLRDRNNGGTPQRSTLMRAGLNEVRS